MIKSILLATDGSDHAWTAWKCALEIARAYAAQVRIVSVVDARVLQDQMSVPIGGFDPLNLETAYTMQLEVKMEGEQGRLLEEVGRVTEAAGVKVQTTLARGIPAEQITMYDSVVDLIALGHRGNRSPWDRLMIGSVAEGVLRKSAKPVLVAPERHAQIEKILAAYDGSELAKRALHWAADLAMTMRLPVDVVYVSHNQDQAQRILGEAREYLRPYELANVHTIIREGKAPTQILETAQEYGAGLIVMGAHGHGRLREALLGSVAEAVMQKMNKPLLLTR